MQATERMNRMGGYPGADFLPDPPKNPKLGYVTGVIPARLASTRLPRKVLREIAGKPMLAWVYEAALACPQFDELVVATDSPEVSALCQRNQWDFIETDSALPSGTDRMARVGGRGDIFVNIQADEPLLRPDHITALLAPFQEPFAQEIDVTTLKVRCRPEDVTNPNVVKVVAATTGRALYFSRATIPYDRDQMGNGSYWKHIGLYAFRRDALNYFRILPPGELEQVERLEQLRILERGLAIHVLETEHDTIGVDTEEDLLRVEALLRDRL